MFGTNRVTSPFREADGSLKVNECFYTLQGEGPDAGRPAIFLRLSHCNLRCFFCDTEFEQGQVHELALVTTTILELAKRHTCNLVVITGGEPLLQNINPLVERLNLADISVSVETAGTVYLEGLDKHFDALRSIRRNLIVCSPKTPKVNPQLEALVGAWKYIVRVGEIGAGGFPMMSTQNQGQAANLFIPRDVVAPIYLQACDEGDLRKNDMNFKLAVTMCLKHGHRLSVQIHKQAGLR